MESWEEDVFTISAIDGTGIPELLAEIEKKVLQTTGREKYTIRTDEQGSELQ